MRETSLVEKLLERVRRDRPHQRLQTDDVVIDLARSLDHPSYCVGASSCVLPNSRFYWAREGRFLIDREVLSLQGVWACDFPALDSWVQSSRKANFLRDMTGNAFTSTVCMAVCWAVIRSAT